MPEDYFEQTLSTWQSHANPWFKCIQEFLSIRLLLSHFHPTRMLDSNFEPVCRNRMKVWYRRICFEIEQIAMLDCTVELCECQHFEFSDLIRVETESRLYTVDSRFTLVLLITVEDKQAQSERPIYFRWQTGRAIPRRYHMTTLRLRQSSNHWAACLMSGVRASYNGIMGIEQNLDDIDN